MRLHVAAFMTLLISSATGAAAFDANEPAPASVAPLSTGRPHFCADDYPMTAVRANVEGATTLAFRVTVEGATKDITIAKSSGSQELDDASVRCATRWQYKPGSVDGVPVEMSWQANVVWKLHDNPDVVLAARCLRYLNEPSPLPAHTGKTSTVFRVMQDGSLTDVKIARSSGNSTLDDAAIHCVTAVHFDMSALTLPHEGLPGHLDLDWDGASRLPQPPAPGTAPAPPPAAQTGGTK